MTRQTPSFRGRRSILRWISGGGICVLAMAALGPWVPVLQITDAETRQTLFARHAPPGTLIEVKAHHSVEGGFITDRLRTIGGSRFVLTASRFSAQGAGLPASTAPGETWTHRPGAFSGEGRKRVTGRILLRVGEKNLNPIRVRIDSADPGGGVVPKLGTGLYEIEIRRRSLLRWVFL